jgi:5-methyltetrahydrofolate--homocysteine methyltransferase
MHTAVKIAPHYPGACIHVLDASRSVTVVASLLDENNCDDFCEEISEEYEDLRQEHYDGLEEIKYVSLAAARAKAPRLTHAQETCVAPQYLGAKTDTDVDLALVRPYIDWNPFFQVWQLRGKYPNRGYPKIFLDADVGAQAKQTFDDAQRMLDQVLSEGWLQGRSVVSYLPANSSQDDIIVYSDDTRTQELGRFHGLRQQQQKEDGDMAYHCLSDFIAPEGSGIKDYLGGFAVGVFGVEAKVAEFQQDHDDYKSIMLKAVADRLAEALAEYTHERMRKESWGYCKDEQLDATQMHKVLYQGIRPAPGYPSQPDHTEKKLMWDLMGIQGSGIELSETYSMMPAAAVSALCFAHPKAEYFAVGKITKEQVEEYAQRKGMTLDEAEQALSELLAYK